MLKVFMNPAGGMYAAEKASTPNCSEIPTVSDDARTVLEAAPRPLLKTELEEAIQLLRAGVPL
jgi:hypothetical protein